MLLLLKAVLEKVLHNAAAQMQCLQLPLLEMAAILHSYIILYVKEWYQVVKNDWVVFLSLKCPEIFLLCPDTHWANLFGLIYDFKTGQLCIYITHYSVFGYVQWHQTSCSPCCTCNTTFSAPPWNYIHICAPFVCPAPNLFCTCNTAFKSRLAPLDMYKYANERLFDLNFLLKLLSKNPKRGKLMRRGDEVKIVYVSSIMRFSD